MTLQRQIGFWLAALAGLLLVLYLLSGVLLPFVAGLILAYLLDPLARRLERLGLSRLLATLLILVLFILLFVLVLVLVVPLVAQQLSAFASNLPNMLSRLQALATERGGPLIERLGLETAMADAQKSVGEFAGQAAEWLTRLLGSLVAGGAAVFSLISLLVITPVVAFYLLIDWQRMVDAVDSWLPRPYRDTIRELIVQMDEAVAGFIRGQALSCLVLGVFYAVALSLLGVNFAVLIGLVSGVLSFIPYIGSLTGLLLSVGVATVQYWPDWFMPAAALAIFVFGQLLEGYVLQPKLIGSAVGLHPVWLMFALVAFGSLFGFVGLLLAVPLAGALGVLTRFAIRQYLASPLYSGEPATAAERPTAERRGG